MGDAKQQQRPWIGTRSEKHGSTGRDFVALTDLMNGVAVAMISFCLGYFPLLSITSKQYPEMVMDEIFHVPQAQEMCRSGVFNAKWDPKITTFPGLYLVPVFLARGLNVEVDFACSISLLRLSSAVAASGAVSLAYVLARMNRDDFALAATRALLIAAIPPFAFFATLYYTESISILSLLAAKWAQQRRSRVLSLLLGLFAILCRQTNAVWLLFFVVEETLKQMQANERKLGPIELVEKGFRNLKALVIRQIPFILCISGFATFVIFFNKGRLVVGDHSAHVASLHLAQPFYLCAFLTALFAPALLPQAYSIMKHAEEETVDYAAITATRMLGDSFLGAKLSKNRLSAIAMLQIGTFSDVPHIFNYLFATKNYTFLHLSMISSAMVHYGTVVHPYLLADNRHLTFYLWKDVLGPLGRSGRWLFAPVYGFSCFSLYLLLRHKGWAWITALAASTCAQLVPSGLIELRYFIPPTVVIILNMRMSPQQLLQCAFDCLILIGIVHYIFLTRGIMY